MFDPAIDGGTERHPGPGRRRDRPPGQGRRGRARIAPTLRVRRLRLPIPEHELLTLTCGLKQLHDSLE
ncbi:hypothetical protein ATKI12_4613 [Kitasatospora sp. Ki12]